MSPLFSRAINLMQVLVINQFFWPDTAATGQLLTDVTRGMDPKAHAVTVLCGTPDYGAVDMDSPPRVKIMRSGGVAFSRGKIGRVVSYASFFAGAAVRGVWGPKPTLVLTLTTPPLISVLGTLLKSLRGSRHFIWEMDLYPDIAVDLNVMKPRSVVTRLIGTVADFSRKRADGIIALGDDMKARLVAAAFPSTRFLSRKTGPTGARLSRLRSRKGRWWCIIRVRSAWPTRSKQLPKQCGSSATTAGSALCSRAAEHVVSGWRSSVGLKGSVRPSSGPTQDALSWAGVWQRGMWGW